MDILAIRSRVREGGVKATVVNSAGTLIGTFEVDDIMFALAGMDTMDIYGKLEMACDFGADLDELSIDLGFIKFGGGEAVIKTAKEWQTLKKAYQLLKSRSDRMYFHVDAMDIADAVIENLPTPAVEETVVEEEAAE
jgi:hypothetical protein